ncbi:MAG: glutathione S-transferase family protein [Betaproteobacteria bacterium]|nr:MAG: glutathione S-transferase family protein [Betaproteobacteria bacterium]
MLVIWGRKNSVNVQKVLWCCEEMNLAYRRIDAGGAFGVVNTAAYRNLNPNGLVPTIEDNGLVLWESNAIVRYLAAKHAPGALWPDDIRTRADADRWMDWSNSTFWPALRPLFFGLIRTPLEKRDPNALEDARRTTASVLAIVDTHLSSREFLAGERFTMGDIALGCGIWRWMDLPIERPALANVQRWFDTLARRPAYQAVVMQPLS